MLQFKSYITFHGNFIENVDIPNSLTFSRFALTEVVSISIMLACYVSSELCAYIRKLG